MAIFRKVKFRAEVPLFIEFKSWMKFASSKANRFEATFKAATFFKLEDERHTLRYRKPEKVRSSCYRMSDGIAEQ
ncbi:hypothetical protein PMIT1342_00011 [Prochlorococcus marinus str. MIT 1342]|nr:hypothetical protein PMIT1342_00011 [Prochlorococcus marinus str. MIT 1342]